MMGAAMAKKKTEMEVAMGSIDWNTVAGAIVQMAGKKTQELSQGHRTFKAEWANGSKTVLNV